LVRLTTVDREVAAIVDGQFAGTGDPVRDLDIERAGITLVAVRAVQRQRHRGREAVLGGGHAPDLAAESLDAAMQGSGGAMSGVRKQAARSGWMTGGARLREQCWDDPVGISID
jgi:hypothetical protein